MTTDPAKLAEFDEILLKWRDAFKVKESRPHCPHREDHDEWFDLIDLKYDGWTSFTYRVSACCPAFEILVLQAATEERMFNPPHFNTGVPSVKYETEKDHRGGAVADRDVHKHAEKRDDDRHQGSGLSESTRSCVERWFEELWNEREEGKIQEWVAPECKVHGGDGALTIGVEAFKEVTRKLHEAIPDLHVEVKYHVVEHDKAASVLLVSGTPASTKKRVQMTSTTFSRWRDGKIVEAWNLADLDSLLLRIKAAAG